MYFRDLLCFLINILNSKKFNIQKCDFFSKKNFRRNPQHAHFLLCVVHKVHRAQNIIFKGLILLQIYIPLHKKNKNTNFCPFLSFKIIQV